ncbi:MAG: hypothetical protein MZW92_59365 [Comamonadaceae bacterium]|nr:hypothetical protein [Comamonadaceae bacterium]
MRPVNAVSCALIELKVITALPSMRSSALSRQLLKATLAISPAVSEVLLSRSSKVSDIVPL